MSMDSRANDDHPRSSRRDKGDPVACERCAAPVQLLTALPRRIDHAAFRIFVCTACNFLQWIPQ
jgi:hypothetical protein